MLGSLLAVGCATYAPSPLLPDVELTNLRGTSYEDLRIEYTQGTPGVDRGTTHFNARDGLDEAELAALALTLNPTLRAKRAEIAEAVAALVSTGSLPNPDIDAFIRSGLDGSSGTGAGIDALFGLLRPDERPAARAVAEAQVEIVRSEVAAEELRVLAEVRRTWIAVLSAEHSVRLLEQELELRNEAHRLVRGQRELGEATEIALVLVELERVGVERQLREAQAAVERERRLLNAHIGLPPDCAVQLTAGGTDLAFTITPDLTDDEIDARLLAGHPDLRRKASEYRRAEQELRLAVARQYPAIGLGPTYERDVEGSEGLGLGLSIEVPLFDRNQGAIRDKLALRERRRTEYRSELHGLRARAFEARGRLRGARTEIEVHQRDVLPLIERTEALVEAALRAREVTAFEWLVARTRAIQWRRDLLDVVTRQAHAAVELDSATGTPLVTVIAETVGASSTR